MTAPYVAHLADEARPLATACGEPWQGWQAPEDIDPRSVVLPPHDQPPFTPGPGPAVPGVPASSLQVSEPEVPEGIYLAAAQAYERAAGIRVGAADLAQMPGLRAAIESAFRAGYGLACDDEADGEPARFRPAPDDGDRHSW